MGFVVASPTNPAPSLLFLNRHYAPTDHLGMDTSQRQGTRRRRQQALTLLLTALVCLIQSGYVYLDNEPLPRECAVSEALQTECPSTDSQLEELGD